MNKGTCSIEGCERGKEKRGYCSLHYGRMVRSGILKTSTNRLCTYNGCGLPMAAKDLCITHYEQQKRGKALTPIRHRHTDRVSKFWAETEKSGPTVPGHPELGRCWQWTGKSAATKTSGKYGRIIVDGKARAAHRFSYELHYGPIPEGHLVDHVCHNTLCVKPGHLRLATKSQNNSYLKGAKANNLSTGVRNVYPAKRKGRLGWRVCVKRQSGGVYDTIEEAEQAAKALRAKLFDFPDF